ncbi:hypothetical protein CSB45_04150 [candidate division KSB3 bacterium]|uniref:Tetratricopeptide repeat protein n=1 Tax=candidate division KSB3 bacterium TaxID=2044937 RepID=A0A2G6E845_9BACT|nr:MAG: hypothetical protein CSB45_04150 [candidate division KSB3 bacterium]PIE30571.1 MAG: hypothetical protein CSA57_02735 [candidate division KSB3 bacterium]
MRTEQRENGDRGHSNTQNRPLNADSERNGMSLPVAPLACIEENIPTAIVQAIKTLLASEETIFVLFRLNSSHTFQLESGKEEKSLIWSVVTGTRILLLSVASDGQSYYDGFDQSAVVEYQNSFGIDSFKIAEHSLSSGFWQGKRSYFQEAAQLFPLPEHEKYLYLTEKALRDHELFQAAALLRTSLKKLPGTKAYLMLLSVLSQQDRRDDALSLLDEALEYAELPVFLDELQHSFPDHTELLLYFAAACEERRDWDNCLKIYQQLLRENPEFDLYFLKSGEIYNATQEYELALEHYHKFIELRSGTKNRFTNWELSEMKCFSTDPDLVKAYIDLAAIYKYALNELNHAVSAYIELLRHAPFYLEAYRLFWMAYQQLYSSCPEKACQLPLHIPTFLQVYQLLAPQSYRATVGTGKESAQRNAGPREMLPAGYRKILDDDQNMFLDSDEQKTFRKLHDWLMGLVLSEENGQGIEEYCEQVTETNYPEIFRMIAQLSEFFDIDVPNCFISRGKIGLSLRNATRPFIFIGSEHLNKDNDRYFSQDELVFLIASKAEYIKSDYLLLTRTELWKSLGMASFNGFLAALQSLPDGGFLGKFPSHLAASGLKKLYKKCKRSNIQNLLDFFIKSPGQKSSTHPKPTREELPEASTWNQEIVDFVRHAVYTGDRAGLLASNQIRTACSAIFKLEKIQAYDDMAAIPREGLLKLLSKQDQRGHFLYFEHARRLGELIKFALSEKYLYLHRHALIFHNAPDTQ